MQSILRGLGLVNCQSPEDGLASDSSTSSGGRQSTSNKTRPPFWCSEGGVASICKACAHYLEYQPSLG